MAARHAVTPEAIVVLTCSRKRPDDATNNSDAVSTVARLPQEGRKMKEIGSGVEGSAQELSGSPTRRRLILKPGRAHRAVRERRLALGSQASMAGRWNQPEPFFVLKGAIPLSASTWLCGRSSKRAWTCAVLPHSWQARLSRKLLQSLVALCAKTRSVEGECPHEPPFEQGFGGNAARKSGAATRAQHGSCHRTPNFVHPNLLKNRG